MVQRYPLALRRFKDVRRINKINFTRYLTNENCYSEVISTATFSLFRKTEKIKYIFLMLTAH